MVKWEYLRLDIYDGSHPIEWNKLGQEGWELVIIYAGVAYFKRPDFNDIADKAIKMIALSSSEIPQNFEGIQSQVKTGYIDAR